MFDGVFKNVGNFFNGIFGGGESDEEKKRRQRQQQQAQAKAQQQRKTQIANPLAQPGKPTQPQNKGVVPNLNTQVTPPPAPAPRPTPAPAPAPQPVKTNNQPAVPKKPEGFNIFKVAGDYAKGVGDVLTDTARGIPRGAITLRKTLNADGSNNDGKPMIPKGQVEQFLLGKDPIYDAAGYAKQTGNDIGALATGKKSNLGSNLPAPIAAILGTVLAATDLTPVGSLKKKGITEIADEVATEAKRSAKVGRALTDAEKVDIEKAAAEHLQTKTPQPSKEIDVPPAKDVPKTQPTTKAGTPPVPSKTEVATRTRQEVESIRDNPVLTPDEKISQTKSVVDKYNEVNQAIDKHVSDTQGIVDESGKKLQDTTEQLAKTAEDVKANQADKVIPTGATSSSPAPNAEMQFNDAYKTIQDYVKKGDVSANDLNDALLRREGIDVNAPDKKVRVQNQIIQNIIKTATRGKSDVSTLGEVYKSGIVDPLSEATSGLLKKGIYSQNPITSRVSQLPRLVWARSGFNEGERQALRGITGEKAASSEVAKVIGRNIKEKYKAVDDVPKADENLTRFFETPEYIQRAYGDTRKVSFEQLTPQEQAIANDLIDFNKVRNRINYETGIINEDQFKQFEDGMHSPRIYDIKNLDNPVNASNFSTTAGIQRKALTDIPDAVFEKRLESPSQSMLVRLEESLRNKAQLDSINNLDRQGLVLDRPPNKGFTQLKGRQFGQYDGKWVDNQVFTELSNSRKFNTEAGQRTDALLDSYRGSFLGKLDRGQKQIKTVFSPGTFIGNVLSNPLAFNRGAGTTALMQSAKMVKASHDLIQHRALGKFDPRIYELERSGVFGQNTGRALTGEITPELTLLKDGKWKKNPIEAMKGIYGGVDDAAKLALYDTLLAKGLTKEKAIQRVGQFTQDYANAGRLIQTLADAPVLGKPFARFMPELVRLMKNNAIYNPVGMVAGLAGLAILQNELSKSAGETPEERAARESGAGQTKLPLTGWIDKLVGGRGEDISLNFPVGDAAVNTARAMGLNFPIEPGGDANTALLKQLVPFVIPTRQNAQGETVFDPAELVSSLSLSPIVDQIFNRDFMDRKITDPENKTIYENGNLVVNRLSGEPSQGDQLINRIRTAAMNYLPFANEADAGINALQGTEDYYGKSRSVPQAIGRMLGFKVEGNDQATRDKRVEQANYFDEQLPAVQSFLHDNPDLAGAYFKINNPTKDRNTNIKESDVITPERWDVINSDTTGRLFNFLKEQSLKNNARDGKPVDPIYTLDPERAKYVAELRSRPSGDDIEAQEILRATQPWYKQYEDAQFAYYDANDAYYKAHPFDSSSTPNPRVEAYRAASTPVEQPAIVKQYYQIKGADPEAAKSFYKANKDALGSAFDGYATQRLTRINAMRKIEGYDPIDPEVFANKTFGFDIKGGGSGYGYGGGGGGYSNDYGILNKLTNETGNIKRLGAIEPAEVPALMAILKAAMANGGGRRNVPKLGAASRGDT
jgi:hypothetical protein